MRFDRLDLKILDALQTDGRMTNLDLADRVGLSPTPCLKRVKKLEDNGVIKGYRADVDPVAGGYSVTAIVLIQIASHTREAHDECAEAAAKVPAIVACHMTAGKLDYILHVLARDLAHYEDLVKDKLSALPNIGSMESLFLLGNADRRRSVSFTDSPYTEI